MGGDRRRKSARAADRGDHDELRKYAGHARTTHKRNKPNIANKANIAIMGCWMRSLWGLCVFAKCWWLRWSAEQTSPSLAVCLLCLLAVIVCLSGQKDWPVSEETRAISPSPEPSTCRRCPTTDQTQFVVHVYWAPEHIDCTYILVLPSRAVCGPGNVTYLLLF